MAAAAAYRGLSLANLMKALTGTVAVSAPYFDHRGQVTGSVGLYGPNARVSDQKMLEFSKLVRKAGHQISVLLGAGDADRAGVASR